ncbi:MAG: putative cobaltochelatase [Thermodesulfobacteriota bacterium]
MSPDLSSQAAAMPAAAPRGGVFPFVAILGQEDMKLALLLNAIDPGVGGVLVRGEKGTAKSTAVRALAALLPEIDVVSGCRLACDPGDPDQLCDHCRRVLAQAGRLTAQARRVPVVELPLNATEDMVLGGLDFERAVRRGRRGFMPGLLARAHRGFLYVDEVNLLDDHLVDVLLDAAASGHNRLEREGVSFSHPARFVLVGTMNPEEGELRPQFLDRFGLCVEVAGMADPELRVRLLQLREAFDQDPAGFNAGRQEAAQGLALAVAQARRRLGQVRLAGHLRTFISALCLENNVAGHRADLVIERAARALAAYEGRHEVTSEDVARVAAMALRHRRRDPVPPPPPPPPPPQEPEPPEEPQEPDQPPEPEQGQGRDQDARDGQAEQGPEEGFDLPLPEPPEPEPEPETGDQGQAQEQVFAAGPTFKVRRLSQAKDRKLRRGSGRRSATRTAQRLGRYVKSSLAGDPGDLALDATLRAAAPHQRRRQGASGLAVAVRSQDIRLKVREKRVGNFLLFVVDASGSMGVQARMAATKGAILSLLLDAYQKRDKVAMVCFRGREANVALPPTSSIDLAARLLQELPVGGRTPLSAGLVQAHTQLQIHLRKEPESRPIVLLLSDGRANAGLQGEAPPHQEALALAAKLGADQRVRFVVVDTEAPGVVRLDLARRLAAAMGADYFRIDDLKAQDLVHIAREDSL